jgi:hypothetical protein
MLCPNDPNHPVAEEEWPQGLGEMTDRGYEQMRALGQRLRQRYVEELGLVKGEFDPQEAPKNIYFLLNFKLQ